MAENMAVVPWNPPENFWQAVQALWFTHMLVMFDERYPGPGVSFGRIDQYMYPYYKKSIDEGMSEEFMKEILGCFWFHCNTVTTPQIRIAAIRNNGGLRSAVQSVLMAERTPAHMTTI